MQKIITIMVDTKDTDEDLRNKVVGAIAANHFETINILGCEVESIYINKPKG